MMLSTAIGKLDMTQRTGGSPDGVEVTGGYASDMLSDVIGNAKVGNIWITIQTHLNIVAVSTLLGLSAIVITGGAQPEEKTLAKAEEEGVVILTTPMKSFEVAGKLYELGLR